MSQCYYPIGKPLRDSDREMRPCPNEPVQTICCSVARTNLPGGDLANGSTQDRCLNNGLCLNDSYKNGTRRIEYWAALCTDKNMTSGNCLNICNEPGQRNSNGATRMTKCEGSDTQFCCGESGACCITGAGMVELPVNFTKGMPYQPSQKLPQPSQSLPQPSPSTVYVNTPATDTGLSSRAVVGIVLGVDLGVLALVALALLVRKAMARRREGQSRKSSQAPDETLVNPKSSSYEIQVNREMMELPTDRGTSELPFNKDLW
ncbi:hypothetical protein DM02DRAFT_634532 [Periconia macrospinosa]|uniref:Mid2 domain-containing protein n=1 Tax=Periconia macrospinosa TaxID=97972 RepID=A0A2V1D5Z3_9PLEO|nr:hypothetical protein DM02DRAFT_634532 [Periconia macrospinosa]